MFQKIDQGRIYERIVDQILQSILSDELKPNDKLPSEKELGKIFGVSRGTIREAIRSLGLMGPRTADALTALYQNEKAVDVRKEIMNAFFLQGNAKALVSVARSEKDPELRKTAVEKLSLMNSKESSDFMMEILNK